MQKPKKKELKQQSLPAACYLRSRYLPVMIRTISYKQLEHVSLPEFKALGVLTSPGLISFFADQAFSTLSNEIVLVRNPGRTKRRIRMTYRGLSENAAQFSKVFWGGFFRHLTYLPPRLVLATTGLMTTTRRLSRPITDFDRKPGLSGH